MIVKVIGYLMKDAGSRLPPGASGEFGSHAIRPRSGHHMQVMTVWESAGFSIVIPAKAGIQRRSSLCHDVQYIA